MAWMGGRTPGPTRQVPVVLLLALVVGCGGGGEGGEGGASSPTRTPTADRSVERFSEGCVTHVPGRRSPEAGRWVSRASSRPRTS